MTNVAAWRDFFTACAGASAALAGLIFVALSVNIGEILKFEHLPARAAAAIRPRIQPAWCFQVLRSAG